MKKTEKWFAEILDSYKNDFEFRLEGLIFELTEQINLRLKKNKISRKQFAEDLNVKPAAVSKILNGNSNFTIRTLLSMADVLKTELTIEFKGKENTSTESKINTTSDDAEIGVKEIFEKSDLAHVPPAWMLPGVTAAGNN
jgi:transcriptional regulator with XRE-family HTH domain